MAYCISKLLFCAFFVVFQVNSVNSASFSKTSFSNETLKVEIEWRVLANFRTVVAGEADFSKISKVQSPKAVSNFINHYEYPQNDFSFRLKRAIFCYAKHLSNLQSGQCLDALQPHAKDEFNKNYRPVFTLYSKFDTRRGDIPTYWHMDEGKYRGEGLYAKGRFAEVFLKNPPLGATCRWDLGAGVIISNNCRGILPLQVGENGVNLSVVSKNKEPVHFDGKLNLIHKNILVLGDSFISGEGNPHRPFASDGEKYGIFNPLSGNNLATWWDTMCHRSLLSWPVQTGHKLAKDNPTMSIAVFSFACSGAETDEGVFGHFSGIETKEMIADKLKLSGANAIDELAPNLPIINGSSVLASQINQAKSLQCKDTKNCKSPLKFDILLTSIGGDDIGFGEHVANFALLDIKSDSQKVVFDKITASIKGLSQKFDKMMRDRLISDIPTKFIMLYPNPLLGKAGLLCSDTNRRGAGNETFLAKIFASVGLGFTVKESRLATSKIIEPLNQKIISHFKKDKTWTVIDTQSVGKELFKGHGYCADDKRFFNTYADSSDSQHYTFRGEGACVNNAGAVIKCSTKRDTKTKQTVSSGAMHPNILGHEAMMKAAYEDIIKALKK